MPPRAGYFRDPITTHGLSDAFRDAELLVRAIEGTSTFAEYERLHNDVTRDLFAVTDRIASYSTSNTCGSTGRTLAAILHHAAHIRGCA